MPAAAEPPAAPAPAAPMPGSAQVAAAAKTSISVPGSGVIETPTARVKPGSAKERLFKNLEKRAKNEKGEPANPEPTPPSKPAEPAKPAAEPPTPSTPVEPSEPEPAAPAQPAVEPSKGDKKSPWKMVDEYKERLTKAEAALLESEKRAIPQAKWDEVQGELKSAKDKLAEYEQEMQFQNYQKSDEFKTKYQQPYEAAWSRAMKNLNGLTVADGQGGERALVPNDIATLVNMDNLREAITTAKEMFGDDIAPIVMNHRNEIRRLFDEQTAAIEDARTTAGKREAEKKANDEKAFGEVTANIKADWKVANDEVMADEKLGIYFKPKDGDAEGNQRLAKGFEMADRAFSENPMKPGITNEQRKEIIRRHAAVRNRAAAFGRLRAWNESLTAEIATLKKELAEYKGTEPEVGGRKEPSPTLEGGTAMDRMKAALRAKAK